MNKEQFLAMSLPHDLKVQFKGIVNGKELSEYFRAVRKESDENQYDFFAGTTIPPVNPVMGLKIVPLKRISRYKTHAVYEAGVKRFKKLHIDDVFPILHPLSDLTREITHNGETFFPIDKILEESCFDLSKMNRKEINSYAEPVLMPELISLSDALLLAEWHFDIAGLIEKGEAIDVNTLPENPYN